MVAFFFLLTRFPFDDCLNRLPLPGAAWPVFDSNTKRRLRIGMVGVERPLGGERGKFQAGLHSRTHRTDGNAIFAEDRDETTHAVSTRCRLNVAPTTARKISGFAIFVSPAVGNVSVSRQNIVASCRECSICLIRIYFKNYYVDLRKRFNLTLR